MKEGEGMVKADKKSIKQLMLENDITSVIKTFLDFGDTYKEHELTKEILKIFGKEITDLIELSKIITCYLGAPENDEVRERCIRLTKELEGLRDAGKARLEEHKKQQRLFT